MVNEKLVKYIEEKVLPRYDKSDKGHGIDHIKYVIRRSLAFAKNVPDINLDMVYVIAAYHDVGHSIDAANHEKVSAEILLADEELKKYFTADEILVMSEAVYDHRASLSYEPRSIYGKIVSSADRNTELEKPFIRTYEYRLKHGSGVNLKQIIDESYAHLVKKFGKKGYANEKMYFEDLEYKKFLEDLGRILDNRSEFNRMFIKINGINSADLISDEELRETFEKIRKNRPELSLDEALYEAYNEKVIDIDDFDIYRKRILKVSGIDELEYYTQEVNPQLKKYVEEFIFPQYEVNDKAHGIVHIVEVIRRAFALNDTFKLGLDPNLIYAIAAYHDLGKHENHKIHEIIAANRFYSDENMKTFFTDEERLVIKEAIEDHRSSKEDNPRSIYGKLISSADRNTRIDIVFIRSFFVAKERMPEENIENYLNYTIDRLSKKYSEENPENMFFEDMTYKVFLQDMRALLKNEEEFKERYCRVNHITSRDSFVKDEAGEVEYANVYQKK